MNILEGRMYAPLLPVRPSRPRAVLMLAALLALLGVGLVTIDARFAKAAQTPAIAAPVPATAHDDGAWGADESRYGSRPDYAH